MTTPQKPLNEKDFIQPEPGRIVPAWVWFFILLLFCGMLLQFFVWIWHGKKNQTVQVAQAPFYQVTNRDMSLFLWQNQAFLQKKDPSDKRYLPAFDTHEGVALETDLADQLVIGPPELLFRYHTWVRQVKNEFSNTPIPVDEFLKFLAYAKEWLPANWPQAPEGYQKLVPSLPQRTTTDLSTLSYADLPLDVRLAYQGWQNHFVHGLEIERAEYTNPDVMKFLLAHPHYARNFWRNIYPDYLKSLATNKGSIPDKELPSFFRQALYNFSAVAPAQTSQAGFISPKTKAAA